MSLPNSLSGFGQDSWIMHGCALVKHGRQRINDYGRDIESLDIGDTVDIARIGGKLKFYVNGTIDIICVTWIGNALKLQKLKTAVFHCIYTKITNFFYDE